MNFGQAIVSMEAGSRVARLGWENGIWVCLGKGNAALDAGQFWNEHTRQFAVENGGAAEVLPYLIMKTAEGKIMMGWMASQEDVLANDWGVLLPYYPGKRNLSLNFPEKMEKAKAAAMGAQFQPEAELFGDGVESWAFPVQPAKAKPVPLPLVRHSSMCLSAGGGPSDDDCICGAGGVHAASAIPSHEIGEVETAVALLRDITARFDLNDDLTSRIIEFTERTASKTHEIGGLNEKVMNDPVRPGVNRITPEHIDAVIDCQTTFNVGRALDALNMPRGASLDLLTITVLTLQNGFNVVGEAGCLDSAQFSQEKGNEASLKNAKDKIWPLEGYLLKQRLSGQQ